VDENYTVIHALFDYYCARSEDGMHFHMDAAAYKVRRRAMYLAKLLKFERLCKGPLWH